MRRLGARMAPENRPQAPLTRRLKAISKHAAFTVIVLCGAVTASKTADAANVENVCDIAARQAAQESGVPLPVLRAVTRTETGRVRAGELRPWPWAVNLRGKGIWFDDLKSARDFAERHLANGERGFDVGCFQINHRWHGEAFRSIDAMFDPRENALYAARFLSALHAEFGDWERAVGAYHSRTPKYANRYKARYRRILAELPPPADRPETAPLTRGAQPLSATGDQTQPNLRSPGSLVPLGASVSTRRLALFDRGG